MGGLLLRPSKAKCALLAVLLAVQGCSTTGSGPGRVEETATQRAIRNCIGSVVISAGIGALAGAVAGGGNRIARGAVIGAAAGVGVCAVLMEVAAAEDRARIREAEQAAIAANATQTRSIRTRSGKPASVTTRVTTAPIPPSRPSQETADASFTACRYAEQTISVSAQSASAGRQLWCRTTAGDWQPVVG